MNSIKELTPAQRLAKTLKNKIRRNGKSSRLAAKALQLAEQLAMEAEVARLASIPKPLNKRERRAKGKADALQLLADAEQARLDALALIEAERLQAIALGRQKKKDDKKAKQALALQLKQAQEQKLRDAEILAQKQAEDKKFQTEQEVAQRALVLQSKIDLNKLTPKQLLVYALKQVKDAKPKHKAPSKIARDNIKRIQKDKVAPALTFEEEAQLIAQQELEILEPETPLSLTIEQQYSLLPTPQAKKQCILGLIKDYPQTAEPQSYLIQTAYFNHRVITNPTSQTISYQDKNYPFVAKQQIEVITHYDLLAIYKQRTSLNVAQSRPIEMFVRDQAHPDKVLASGNETSLKFDTVVELLCPSFNYYQKVNEVNYLLFKIALGYVADFRTDVAILELASIKLNVANKVLTEQESFIFQTARSHAVNRIFHSHTVYEEYDYETFKNKTISEYFGVNHDRIIQDQEGGCVLKAIIQKFDVNWNKYHCGTIKRTPSRPALTFEYLSKLFNCTAETSYAVSIQQAIELFFKPNRLVLRVFDRFNRIIAFYAPEASSRCHIAGQLEVCFANQHFYVLNHNIESLIQKTLPSKTVDDWVKVPSSEYPKPSPKPRKIYTMTTMQEYTQLDFTKDLSYNVITSMNLHHVCDYIRYNLQYTPGILVDEHNNIVGLKTKAGENVITILNDKNLPFSDVGFNPTDETSSTPAEQLEAFNIGHSAFCTALMNEETYSHYETNFVHNSRLTFPGAVNNVISASNPQPNYTMDKSKCYPSAFYQMRYRPRVNRFDKYCIYNDEKIVAQHFYTLQVHTPPPEYLIPLLNQHLITYPGFILLTPIQAPLTKPISHKQYERDQLLRQRIKDFETQIHYLSDTYPMKEDRVKPKAELELEIKAVEQLLTPYAKKKNLLFYLKPYVKIVAYCTVGHITHSNKRVQTIIKGVLTSQKMTHNQAKNALNLAIGKTEKTRNEVHIGLLVDTQAEAINYAQQLGGTAYPYDEVSFPTEQKPLRSDPTAPLQPYINKSVYDDDFFFAQQAQELCDVEYDTPVDATSSKRSVDHFGAHTVQRNYCTPLITGYLPLNMFGKAIYRLELFHDHQKVYKLTGTPHSYNTDGINFHTSYRLALILKSKAWSFFGKNTLYPFNGNLQTKLISTLPLADQPQLIFSDPPAIEFESPLNEENYKTCPLYQPSIDAMFHARMYPQLPTINNLKVQGPLPQSTTNHLVVEASSAGVGKSYAIIQYLIYISKILPHNRILVSTPTNQRLLALKKDLQHLPNIDFSTCHKLLGLRMEDQQDERQEKTGTKLVKESPKKTDLSSYSLLFVDEVYILSSMNISLLDSCIKNAPQLNVILTGDHLQQTILDINVPDCSTYMLNAVRSMCNTGILLKQQKRLQDPQQQKDLMTIKETCLNGDRKSMLQYIGKTMCTLEEIDELFIQNPNAKGICYYQSLRRYLNQREQDRRTALMRPVQCGLHNKCYVEIGKYKLYGGNMLKCKQRMNASAYTFFNNETVQFIGLRTIGDKEPKQYAIFTACPHRVIAEDNRKLLKLQATAKAKGQTYRAPVADHSKKDAVYLAEQIIVRAEEKEARVVKVPVEYFDTNDYFEFTYFDTSIQTQGDSYDVPLIIFNTDDCGLTDQGVYTTISRATNLRNVHCFLEKKGYDENGDRYVSQLGDAYSESIIRGTIAKHITSHKSVDNKNIQKLKRYIHNGPNYIDEDFAYNQLYIKQRYCIHCKIDLHVKSFSNRDRFSIDRINDGIAHLKSNCVASCLACNNARRMKTHPPALY